MIRQDFLASARAAADLLRAPEVAAAWTAPSALPEFTVRGLSGHLAFQVLAVRQALADPVPEEETVDLCSHYDRAGWIDASLDDPVNVRIRDGGEQVAADGAGALLETLDAAIEDLAETLPEAPNRPVRLRFWGPWSVALDDLLLTRMMEVAVHNDHLAVSVGVPAPPLPGSAMEAVLGLLTRLAVRRHGATEVMRALTRAERAPASITAF
ncbi:maleylpyruvate isomerase N-terminal domain-containing protein [Nonomuraea typhae]|uniref:maleylpyruvate isomerase N-terminal domain-containing protein n=1 Tax=Nonomuraea typhae TaxID=2603600 RepID=UPI0012F73BDB|nr:maleylpyruvate isomerase N-terminal domain-containing protein [Nonomuraea typhae]